MPEVFRARFSTNLDGFSAGVRTTAQGSATLGEPDGAIEIGAGVTSNCDFTEIVSGRARVDFSVLVPDSSFGAANTTSLIFLLPPGAAALSANSLATVAFDRQNSGNGTGLALTYRGASGFAAFDGTTNTFLPRGTRWLRFSMVVDFASKTVDFYVGDVLWLKAKPWPNASATGLGRIALSGQASAPPIYFDDIALFSNWTEPDVLLVDQTFTGGSGEIEALVPSTARDAHAQPWYIPQDAATYGGLTVGAAGASFDAGKKSFALTRCAQDGVLECEFSTPASGTPYIGVLFRFWDFPTPTGGGGGVFRINGASSNAALFIPDRAGAQQTVQSVSQALSLSTIYTLRLEMRGRVLIGSIKASAMDTGTYTQLFTHTVVDSLTGGRGMLIEELCGPYNDGAIGTSTVRRFRFRGLPESSEAVRTIGRWKWGVGHGSVKEAYSLDSAAPTANLLWSRGIQFGHRSSADQCGQQQQATIYDTSNVYAVRQIGANLTEYQWLGFADCYVTLLRRGPWISDGIVATDTTENFAPDFDLRPNLWSAAFVTAISSGAAVARSDSPLHDWIGHHSGVSLPAGQQSFTAFASGQQAHVSQVVIADGAVPSLAWDVTSKFEGNGDPISRAVSTQGANLSAGGSLRVARAFLLRSAAALDGATLTAWRDNLASPGSLAFTAGNAKTDAPGDTGATGFNRRHGWHEIQCAGGTAAWTLPVASGTRHMPVFRLHGWSAENTALSINGGAATPGTDYVIDEVASGVAVLQVLSDRTSNTTFALGVPSTPLTVTTDELRDEVGALRASESIAKVAALRLSDLSVAASWANVTTSPAGALTLTAPGLTAVPHIVVTVSADGADAGAKVYTPG